jgi:hypothetical protein
LATLGTQQANLAGLAPSYQAAAAGGDEFSPDERTVLIFKNGGGGAVTVTVITTGSGSAGQAEADVAVSVPAGGERHIGPFPRGAFLQPDGLAGITYSGVAGLTVAAVRH